MFITCPIDLPIFPSFSSHVHLRPGNLMIQRPDVKKLLATASDEPPESRDGISWGHDIIIHIYNYKTKYLYNSYHAQNIESTFDIFWSWIFNGETGILPSKHQHKWPNWISFWPSGSTTKKCEFCFYQHCSGSQQGLRLKNSIPVMLQLFVATLRIGTCVLQCRFFVQRVFAQAGHISSYSRVVLESINQTALKEC